MSEPSTPKRRRGRPSIPDDVQRRRLLSAATRAFASNRYETTRVADIVREAGMSSRSFYEFFESKEDLVAAVVHTAGEAFVENLRQIFREAKDPLERIERGLRAYLDLFEAAPIDLESLGGSAGHKVREARRQYVAQITEMVLGELQLIHEQGDISRVPDRRTVQLILTGIEGMSFRFYSEGRIEELRDLHPVAADLLVRVFL